MQLIVKYAVLTYAFASLKFPSDFASANLFLSPLPRPISKNENHDINELKVSQIP